MKGKVQAASVTASQTRGLYGQGGRAALAVTQFSANQVARREGHVRFKLALSDRASGRVLFQDAEDVLKISGSIITFDAGVFASTEDLRAITALALNTAIDQAMDKPGFTGRQAASGAASGTGSPVA